MPILKQVTSAVPAMGLEQVGKSLFEGASSFFQIPQKNGKFVLDLPDPELKHVEKYYGCKISDEKANEVYGSLMIEVSHIPKPIDYKNAEHLLMLGIIRTLGLLAPSEDAVNPNKNYKFVIEDLEAQNTVKTNLYQKRGKAIVILNDLYKNQPKYLVAIAKYLINFGGKLSLNSTKQLNLRSGVRYNSEMAFNSLMEFIDGKLTNKANESVDLFLDAVDVKMGGKLPISELYTRVDVYDAVSKGVLKVADGYFYNPMVPETRYGRTTEEILNFLQDPTNSDHLGVGNESDMPFSIRRQLKKLEI